MSPQKPPPYLIAAVVLSLACAAVIAWSVSRRLSAEASARDAAKNASDLGSAVDRERARVAKLRRMEADLQDAERRLADKAGASAKAAKKPDFAAVLSGHPKLLATFEKAAGLYFEQLWGGVFRHLDLSARQTHEMETAMIHDLENQMDLNATARAQGLSNDDPAIAKMRQQNEDELQASEEAVLGSQTYDAFQAVQRAEAVRGAAEQVSYMTMYSAYPLTGQQIEQLTQLMAQSSSSYQNGAKATPETIDWAAVLAQAPAFLSQSQIAALQGAAEVNQAVSLVKQFAAAPAAGK